MYILTILFVFATHNQVFIMKETHKSCLEHKKLLDKNRMFVSFCTPKVKKPKWRLS